MRYLKSLTLLALVCLGALALLGASSASAEFNTQLCLSPEEEVCNEPASEVHVVLKEGTVGKFLSDVIDLLCLEVLVLATLLELGTPHQEGHVDETFRTCGSNATHNNCTITTEEKPFGYLLRTGEKQGVLVAEGGQLRLKCTILGFIKIDCSYKAENLEVTIEDPGIGEATDLPISGGGNLCPEETYLDGEMVALEPVYIRS